MRESSRLRVLSVIGTRPEAIKMAPVVRALQGYPGVESQVCVTAQHREMVDEVLRDFAIKADHDLDVMRRADSLGEVAAAVLLGMSEVIADERPDWVLVQGDTTTVAAAALAAVYAGARVGHVEAGLRSFDKHQPFPEETNRRVASVLADLHFAPTERARDNLLREGIPSDDVLVTGNTVIDALALAIQMPHDPATGPLAHVPHDRRIVLLTTHRRENHGDPLVGICMAARELADTYPDDIEVVVPVHPNPAVSSTVIRELGGVRGVTLVPPQDYLGFTRLLERATLVLTDSGGIQEEAPALARPVLVLRDVTERPEAVESGTAMLVGTKPDRIVAEARRLLDDPGHYGRMARAANPFGDGQASVRIVEALLASAVPGAADLGSSVATGAVRGTPVASSRL